MIISHFVSFPFHHNDKLFALRGPGAESSYLEAVFCLGASSSRLGVVAPRPGVTRSVAGTLGCRAKENGVERDVGRECVLLAAVLAEIWPTANG